MRASVLSCLVVAVSGLRVAAVQAAGHRGMAAPRRPALQLCHGAVGVGWHSRRSWTYRMIFLP